MKRIILSYLLISLQLYVDNLINFIMEEFVFSVWRIADAANMRLLLFGNRRVVFYLWLPSKYFS